MSTPNFEEFKFTGTDDVSLLAQTIANRVSIVVPTGEMLGDTEQKLMTFITTPSNVAGDEVLVRLTEFADENGRPSGAIFDSLIAESTRRRVISTNLPGIDFYGDGSNKDGQKLTQEQAQDLRQGSFRMVGKSVMHATRNASTKLSIAPEFVILGTSMSAGIGAGVLNAANKSSIPIKGATFAEPTNVTPRSQLELGTHFLKAGLTAGGYVKMNPAILRDASEPIATIAKRALNPTNFLYARALASGSLIEDLGSIDHLQDVPIYLARGAASRVSPERGFDSLRKHLAQTADVEAYTFGDQRDNPHNHGYVLAVQPFIDAAQNVLDRQ